MGKWIICKSSEFIRSGKPSQIDPGNSWTCIIETTQFDTISQFCIIETHQSHIIQTYQSIPIQTHQSHIIQTHQSYTVFQSFVIKAYKSHIIETH